MNLIKRFEEVTKTKEKSDEQLMSARGWMQKYEQGYGLSDAVKDIRKLKAQIKEEQNNTMKLTKKVNDRDRQLQKWVSENKTLREKFNVSDEWHLDENELDLYYNVELQKAKTK